MMARTLVRTAIAAAVALWLTRMICLKSIRRKATTAGRVLYDALTMGVNSPLTSPPNASCFGAVRAAVKAANGAHAKGLIPAPGVSNRRAKTRSIVELAGSVKSPISGVSIEDMNPWREGPSLAWLMRRAKNVQEDGAYAAAWMSIPHRELDGKTPIDAAITKAGAEQVEAILWRLIHGMPT
ncbi:MbcA/ParS/Xre antitoxin family protein [Caballeronia sp. J97]|uniref:MbcA/ParS/Xre antitoxin family protein n=1 Tax=Caballeronia sp. J97 TaxID=2805429 RepID=UPI002AB328B4|nr:MbcA/ParS/Xre antitoxin family protein [Caballeronia sp. J97]